MCHHLKQMDAINDRCSYVSWTIQARGPEDTRGPSQYKDVVWPVWKPHYKDKTVSRPSCLDNGNPYIWKKEKKQAHKITTTTTTTTKCLYIETGPSAGQPRTTLRRTWVFREDDWGQAIELCKIITRRHHHSQNLVKLFKKDKISSCLECTWFCASLYRLRTQ